MCVQDGDKQEKDGQFSTHTHPNLGGTLMYTNEGRISQSPKERQRSISVQFHLFGGEKI